MTRRASPRTARGRGYHVAGERVPSVTTCLRWAGFRPSSAIPENVLEHARARGVMVHTWIDGIHDGHVAFNDTAPDEIEPYVDGYRRFVKETGWQRLESEVEVHNTLHRYAGRYDARGIFQGDAALVDFKATYAIEPHTRLQLSGYVGCIPGPHVRLAVRLGAGKKGYEIARYDDTETDWHDWLACVRAAHFKLRHGYVTL